MNILRRANQTPTANAISGLRTGDYFLLASLLAFFFEGAIRKWVLSIDHPLFYPVAFSKELLAIFGILLSTRLRPFPALDNFRNYIFRLPLMLTIASFIIAAVQEFTWVGAFMTFRSLVFLPIAACMLGSVFNPNIVKPAIRIVTLAVLVNVPLSIVQFNSSKTDPINCYVGGSLEDVATTGFSENVRATGTFSYLSGLGFGAVACVSTGLVLLVVSTRVQESLNGWMLLVGGLVMALATVSRGPTFTCLILILFSAIRFSRVRLPALVIASLSFVVLFMIETSGSSGYGVFDAIFLRSSQADSSVERIMSPLYDFFMQVALTPMGTGLGLGQGVTRREGGNAVVETEFARVVCEIGIVGFLGFCLTYLGAVAYLFKLSRSAANPMQRGILVGCSLLCFGLLYSGVAFNHISSMIFWSVFAAGCLLIEFPISAFGGQSFTDTAR